MVELLNITRTLVERFYLGWIDMFAILVCSIVGLTIFLERLWFLREGNVMPRKFMVEVEDLLKRKKLEEARSLCLKDDSSLARILFAGVSLFGQKGAAMEARFVEERLEEIGRQEAHRLEGSSDVLGTIATVAPLLGLLGTVLGMVEVFSVIANEGIGQPTLLAGGLSTALLTTVYGLVVAIPSLIAFKFCTQRARHFVVEMERFTLASLRLMADPS